MSTLPAYRPDENYNYSPHLVILGAGASLATLPEGDKFGKRLPLMNNLVELVGLEKEINEIGIQKDKRSFKNFENLFSDLYKSNPNNPIIEVIKSKIYKYFRDFAIPDELTLYDKLILSLREKDMIATFNWDPFLGLAYQRNRHIKRLPRLVFLHGNVFVGICETDKTTGFTNCACSKCGRMFVPTDLLYPIKNKDYTNNPFIKDQWDQLKNFIKYAYLVTIFGYSAPKTDIAAKNIMLDVWRKNETRELAQIEFVDLKSKAELEKRWAEFFTRDHYWAVKDLNETYLMHYPRRSCEAFASATLQQDPWGTLSIPKTNSLNEFQQWILETFLQSERLHDHDKKNKLSRW